MLSIKKKPNDVTLLIKLGKTYEKLRDFEEAINTFKMALRRDKKSFTAHYRIGLIFIKNNEREEGIEALLQAHAINPNDIDTLNKLSDLFLRENKI